MFPRLMTTKGEEHLERGLRKEESNERSLARMKLVFDVVMHAGSVRAEAFEPVRVAPGAQRTMVLHVDKGVQRHVLVTSVPLDAKACEGQPKLCHHAFFDDAALDRSYAQRRRCEEWERLGGAMKVANDLYRSGDVEVGGKVLDTKGLGPSVEFANAESQGGRSDHSATRRAQRVPHRERAFFA